MKVKLIKLQGSKEGNFALEVLDKDIPHWAKTSGKMGRDPHYSVIASTSIQTPFDRLSLKNCQAIENGYDLDELAKEYKSKNGHIPTTKLEDEIFDLGFRDGFKKAIEILGDKKFSEKDIQNFIDNESPGQYPYIASQLKQKSNEWDVEVLMSKTMLLSYPSKKIPELDSDGCLILKRL